ncbi:cutinase [Xylariaceae sp. FL0804]|nr:cutinase [Xylariaceae sp. FL0804]
MRATTVLLAALAPLLSLAAPVAVGEGGVAEVKLSQVSSESHELLLPSPRRSPGSDPGPGPGPAAVPMSRRDGVPYHNVVEVEDEDSVTTRSDLEDAAADAPCPEIILIYARGTLEPGNMGLLAGPELAGALEARYGLSPSSSSSYSSSSSSSSSAPAAVWVQGVGAPGYTADLADNFLAPNGTSAGAVAEAARLLALAHARCPAAAVVAAGYSQGAAVVAAAVSGLAVTAPSVTAQIQGVVLFGFTRNRQDGGHVPGFPADRTKVYCNADDAVCDGTLFILPEHFLYSVDALVDAPAWLAGQLVGLP